jgi:hypothetical protein
MVVTATARLRQLAAQFGVSRAKVAALVEPTELRTEAASIR